MWLVEDSWESFRRWATLRAVGDGENCECFATRISEIAGCIVGDGFRTSFRGLACFPSRFAGRGYAGGDRGGSVAAAVSFVAGTQLDERSEWADFMEGQVSHVLPVQPERGAVGGHALGTRGECGHGALETYAGVAGADTGRI